MASTRTLLVAWIGLLVSVRENGGEPHASATCLASCRYFAAMLWAALNGATTKQQLLDSVGDIELPPSMERIAEKRFVTATADEVRGTGYAVDCLEAALWAFWNTDSFEAAILAAANLGDDADTTAAVCGQLAGAFHSRAAIPADWLATLAMRQEVEAIAIALKRGD